MTLLDTVIIIPARCGSKRVRLKNIKPLLGKPLLLYTIEAAEQSGVTDEILVSTDCEEIATVARAAGARVIIRPDEFATDEASTESVLLHCLDNLRQEGRSPEWVMTLPPSSPLRTSKTIMCAREKALNLPNDIDCLFSVHETRDDFWIGDTPDKVRRLFPDAPRRQQDRRPMWVENSCVYLTKVKALQKTGIILGEKYSGFEIPFEDGFDINSETDFIIAEQLLKSRIQKMMKVK